MFRLALICVALVLTRAENKDDHCCSIEDRREVLALWESVWSAEYTGRRLAIAQAAFHRLFEKEPESKSLFTKVNVEQPDSAEFKAHCIRVTNGMDTLINLAFDPPSLEEQLHHLAVQHSKYEGMKPEYLKSFRDSFAEILPQAIPCFNVAAWNRCMKEMHDWIARDLKA